MCPYFPNLNKETLFQSNQLIKGRFDAHGIDRKDISFIWPIDSKIPLPKYKSENKQNTSEN